MKTEDLKILLVDDEHSIVNLLTSYLSKNGYSVLGLTDSKAALKCIKENTYDIVLTDLKMPGVSGMDIISAIKESGNDTEIIIFIKAFSITVKKNNM